MTSESWPGSTTLSTSALASLGSSGISLMTRLATSLTFITSASSSTSVEGESGSACTRAVMKGSWPPISRMPDARDPLQDHREVVLGQLDDLEDAGGAADHIEIARAGLLGPRVALGDDADDGALFGDRLLDQFDRLLATDVDGDDRPREQDGVPQGQNGDDVGDLDRPFGHRFLCGHGPIVYARGVFRQSRRGAKIRWPARVSGISHPAWRPPRPAPARGKIEALASSLDDGAFFRMVGWEDLARRYRHRTIVKRGLEGGGEALIAGGLPFSFFATLSKIHNTNVACEAPCSLDSGPSPVWGLAMAGARVSSPSSSAPAFAAPASETGR